MRTVPLQRRDERLEPPVDADDDVPRADGTSIGPHDAGVELECARAAEEPRPPLKRARRDAPTAAHGVHHRIRRDQEAASLRTGVAVAREPVHEHPGALRLAIDELLVARGDAERAGEPHVVGDLGRDPLDLVIGEPRDRDRALPSDLPHEVVVILRRPG